MSFALLYEEAVVGILKNILMFLGMQLLKVQLFWIRFIFAFLNDLGPKSSKIAIVNSRNFWHIFDLCFNLCARIVARRGKLRAICTY